MFHGTSGGVKALSTTYLQRVQNTTKYHFTECESKWYDHKAAMAGFESKQTVHHVVMNSSMLSKV